MRWKLSKTSPRRKTKGKRAMQGVKLKTRVWQHARMLHMRQERQNAENSDRVESDDLKLNAADLKCWMLRSTASNVGH